MKVSASDNAADPEPMMEINTTPLIDVMLVLIIMLIITIPIQTHAVKLNMPVANPPSVTPPEIVEIYVDFDDTILWNGVVVPTRPQLEARLQAAAAQAVQPEVHLRPNKLVEYKTVSMVMASAQRLGITKLGVIGNEQFAQ
ncbi:MAG: biopolymer transporter ExbD [Sterolibacterium sp.]|nr:biopolymer transporter ExbD [Sterolibacterium sp.]